MPLSSLSPAVKDTSKSCIFDFPDRPVRPVPPDPLGIYPYDPIDDPPEFNPDIPPIDPPPPDPIVIPPGAISYGDVRDNYYGIYCDAPVNPPSPDPGQVDCRVTIAVSNYLSGSGQIPSNQYLGGMGTLLDHVIQINCLRTGAIRGEGILYVNWRDIFAVTTDLIVQVDIELRLLSTSGFLECDYFEDEIPVFAGTVLRHTVYLDRFSGELFCEFATHS